MSVARAGVLALGVVVDLAGLAACHCANNNSVQPVSPTITVTDATTGAAICDATMLAYGDGNDAGTSLVAETGDDAASLCEYGTAVRTADGMVYAVAPLETPGTYTLVVSRTGFRSQTVSNVTVVLAGASCEQSPAPQHVNVVLQPD